MPNIHIIEEWEPKEDKYYYGDIREDVSLSELAKILASGILKYKIDVYVNTNEIIELDDLLSIIDSWIEHDSDTEKIFEHLIGEVVWEYFELMIVKEYEKLINITKSDIDILEESPLKAITVNEKYLIDINDEIVYDIKEDLKIIDDRIIDIYEENIRLNKQHIVRNN